MEATLDDSLPANRLAMIARKTPHCPRLLSLVLLGTLAWGACSEAPREEVRLVDFDFAAVAPDSLYGPVAGTDRGLHEFDENWAPPKGEALWSLGETASVQLTLLGQDARLELRCSTAPELVQRGQQVSIHLNGRELDRRTLPRAWQVDTLRIDVPDGVLVQGANRLEIRATEFQAAAQRKPARAVYLHSLRVSATLDASQRATWSDWSQPAAAPAYQQPVHLPPDPSTAHLPQRQDFGPDQPDLLMVVLDAARADHFSCYGYERETSPNVDALAREGVRLENFFAEAPYTRSSVATLFTGHSWRDHGVLLRKHSLSPSFTTLAELLQEAGYHTLGITDNANVARSAGSDQGFEEWVQTWSDVRAKKRPGQSWWWPELPEVLWRERLNRGLPEDKPVFAYVHLMPPHEPYFPGEEHDLFGPEGYAGPVIGNTPNIQAFEKGEFAGDGPDHDRLVALYDGGLRRGDAILGRVLEEWATMRERDGRTRPTLTVFLSDHGEAFGEHGRYGHNSSPHDEMVRVPLVFHPASLVPPALQESNGAMRAMSDVLPLLLHSLHVPLPRGTTWPRHLLRVLEDPSVARNEIFIRCSAPIYARRTEQSLSILRVWGEQSFYDLASDPSGRSDLRWARPEEFLPSLSQLRGFVEMPAGASPEAANLSDEDIARLKALGYL